MKKQPISPTKEMFMADEQETDVAKKDEVKIKSDSQLPSATHNVIDLPSAGKFGYPSYVEYRDIMVGDEEILASATAETYSKTLNAVLKSVMNDCKFYEDMIIHDRDFMLLWIWANNYTSVKEVEVTCGNCGTKTKHKIDLTKLPAIPVKDNIKYPFEVDIKKSGGVVKVRLNTVADELFVEEYVRRHKDVKFGHAMMVKSIDLGIEMPFELKMKWVANNISGREMGIIRKYHSHFSFGIETVIEHKCPACSEVTRGAIPFQTEDILFPTVSADFEEYL